MWSISQGICLMILIGIAVMDICWHKVPIGMLVAAGIGAIIYQISVQNMDIRLVAGGMITGALFIILSKVTREEIGYGDSLGILILGIYLGLWKVVELLCTAFFLLLFVSIPMFLCKKASRKRGIPFYPFLAIGYLLLLLGDKGVI